MRTRHRRVRNAINHGNPLTTAALESVRGFAERTAQAALGIACEAYSSNTRVDSMLTAERANRQEQRQGLAKGPLLRRGRPGRRGCRGPPNFPPGTRPRPQRHPRRELPQMADQATAGISILDE
jgi:hypothetical protein